MKHRWVIIKSKTTGEVWSEICEVCEEGWYLKSSWKPEDATRTIVESGLCKGKP